MGRRQNLANVVAGNAADVPVGQRVHRGVVQDPACDLTDPRRRDLIARKRQARERVADRRGDAREITVAPGCRRHRDRLEAGRFEPRALVVPEREQLVLDERAAQRAAKHVLPALRLGRARAVVRPGVRVHAAVPVELEHAAFDKIRAGFDDVADDRARHVPDVGGVVVRLDADLGQRVGAGLVRDEVVDRLVHVDAVDHVVVGLLPVPVHVRPAAAADVAGAGECARIRRHDAGQEQRELAGVPAVQRQRVERRARNDLADRRRLGLQNRRHARDLDRLFERADLQLEVDPQNLLRFELNGLRRRRLEPGKLRLDHVRPNRERRHGVVAGFVGDGGVQHVRGLIGGGHGRTRHGRAGLIGDDARQRSCASLSQRGGGSDQSEGEQEPYRKKQSRRFHSLLPELLWVCVTMAQPGTRVKVG